MSHEELREDYISAALLISQIGWRLAYAEMAGYDTEQSQDALFRISVTLTRKASELMRKKN